jgi:hypothetical protein
MRTHTSIGLTLLAGCADPLPSPSTVDVLRILALSTPTPEARPGEAIAVRAVWFDPAASRRVHWRWRVCDPGVADDPRACARATGSTEIASGAVDHVTVTGLSLGAAESARTWVVYAVACPEEDAVIDAREGRLACPSGMGSEAFRRVTVRAAAPLNRPPAIAAWTLDVAGSPIALDDGASVTVTSLAACAGDCAAISFTLTPAADAAERFSGGSESLLASIYVSSGSVSPPRVVNDPGVVAPMVAQWRPGRVAGGEVARVWAVLRDQRGGETVRAVTITAP